MNSYTHAFVACFMLLAFAIAPIASYGQTDDKEDVSRTERNALPDVDLYPLHVGSFEFLPKLKVSQFYITNIFAQNLNETDDFVTALEPSVNIRKQYRDHEFRVDAAAAVLRYVDNDSENIENYNAAFSGFLTAYHSLRLPFLLSYQIDHQQRNQERTLLNADSPIKFQSLKGETGFEYVPNRLFWYTYGRFEKKRFDNGQTGGGVAVIREDGDFDNYELETRVGYQTQTEWAPFIGLTLGTTSYLRNTFTGTGFNGVSRDNSYYRLLTGVDFSYHGLITGSIGGGYTQQSYDDSSIDDISALALQANIDWSVSDRAIIQTNLSRRVEEDNILNTGVVETEGALGLNYELDRDLFLNTYVSATLDEFDVGGREDELYTGNIELYYVINPRFQLEGGYTYRLRESNLTTAEYDQNIFMLSVTGSL